MTLKVPEAHRLRDYSSEDDGNNGIFIIHAKSGRNDLKIIASDGLGWEHVSVSKKYECPTWEEMCKVKDLFWDPEDCVVQYHPPASKYVNNHHFCLHLWRPVEGEIPLPPDWMVGFK